MADSNSHWDEHEVASNLFEQGKYEEALTRYLVLAEAGSTTAQVFVGWMYHEGRGIRKDLDEAQRWYSKAADAGSPVGQFYLGMLYWIEKKYRKAFEWLEKSASQGYSPAIYRLGTFYDLGEGGNLDKDNAYRCYEQAAEMGHLAAQKEMAVSMIKGYRGLLRIPQGVFMFARSLCKALTLAGSDPDSDRIRW